MYHVSDLWLLLPHSPSPLYPPLSTLPLLTHSPLSFPSSSLFCPPPPSPLPPHLSSRYNHSVSNLWSNLTCLNDIGMATSHFIILCWKVDIFRRQSQSGCPTTVNLQIMSHDDHVFWKWKEVFSHPLTRKLFQSLKSFFFMTSKSVTQFLNRSQLTPSCIWLHDL